MAAYGTDSEVDETAKDRDHNQGNDKDTRLGQRDKAWTSAAWRTPARLSSSLTSSTHSHLQNVNDCILNLGHSERRHVNPRPQVPLPGAARQRAQKMYTNHETALRIANDFHAAQTDIARWLMHPDWFNDLDASLPTPSHGHCHSIQGFRSLLVPCGLGFVNLCLLRRTGSSDQQHLRHALQNCLRKIQLRVSLCSTLVKTV